MESCRAACRTSRRRATTHSTAGAAGVEGAGGSGGPGQAIHRQRAPTDGKPPRCRWTAAGPGRGAGGRRQGQGGQHTDNEPRPIGGRRGACGARPRCRWAVTGLGRQRTDNEHRPIGGRRGADQRCRAWPRCRWAVAGPGRASRSTTPSRRLACGDLAGGPPPTGTHSGPAPHSHTQRSRPAPQGPGGSRIRPLGGSQRLFQRIWVPSEPRRWQASTTRAAMPASADLPHVRGSYCFFTPTSPSILRTPS